MGCFGDGVRYAGARTLQGCRTRQEEGMARRWVPGSALPWGHVGSRNVPGRWLQCGPGPPSTPLPAPHSQLIKALPLF